MARASNVAADASSVRQFASQHPFHQRHPTNSSAPHNTVILQKTISQSPSQLENTGESSNQQAVHGHGKLGEHGWPLPLFCLLLFMLVFWCMVPMLGHHSPPLDVIEMHTWAQVPQWGYYKHPPLPAWCIYISQAIFGRNSFALFFPSALSITFALAAVWPLARRFFGTQKGLIAMFAQASVAYYHIYSADYNHNVAQMPFWAMAVTSFYFAISEGRKRWWLLYGLMLGLAGLGKYSVIFLPMACAALLLWDKTARQHLRLANILLALVGGVLVTWPHLWWLWLNDFVPLDYARERLQELAANSTWSTRFISYLGMQVAVHIVMLVAGLFLFWRTDSGLRVQINESAGQKLNQRFLWLLGMGPFAITLVIGLTGGFLHPMWASAMFPLSGLLFVYCIGETALQLRTRRWLLAWLAVMLVFGAAYAAKSTILWTHLTGKYTRAAYPGPELAAEIDARWQAAFPGKPLRYIIGTPWEAGIASFYSKHHPHIVIDADLRITPWVSAAQITACGALTIAEEGTDLVSELNDMWPEIEEQTPFRLRAKRPQSFPELGMAWAIIAPSGDCR